MPDVSQLGTAIAAPFEIRWTLSALHRIDPDLHDRLLDQMGLYHQALVTGEPEDVDNTRA